VGLGEVLDLLVQRRRDKAAAVKLMRKLLKKQGFALDLLVRDRLRSYAAAMSEMGLSARYEQGLRRNNWLRSRISRRDGERKMQRSKSRGSTSKFLSPTLPCTILSTSNAISRELDHTTCSAPRR
jgi:putative transposase